MIKRRLVAFAWLAAILAVFEFTFCATWAWYSLQTREELNARTYLSRIVEAWGDLVPVHAYYFWPLLATAVALGVLTFAATKWTARHPLTATFGAFFLFLLAISRVWQYPLADAFGDLLIHFTLLLAGTPALFAIFIAACGVSKATTALGVESHFFSDRAAGNFAHSLTESEEDRIIDAQISGDAR